MKLFPHQSQALEKIRDHDHGVFNITCGGGKSRIIKEAALLYKISIVFAPTKNLVSQFYRDYFQGDEAFVPVIINSDNPVDDTTVESVKDALETDTRIVFLCNYQSLHVVQQLCVDLGVVIDIVMFDEAHNVTSKNSRGKLADMKVESESRSDGMDVDDESVEDSDDTSSETSSNHVYQVDTAQVAKLQARKTFFFTATPTRVMKNHPDIYGDELIRYTYAQAVTDGVVKNVDTVIECYAADDKSCLDAGYDRLIPAINRFIADAGVSRVIVYTSHVRDTLSSKASVDGLVKNKKLFDKNVVVHAVTASTSLQQRDKIFNTFRGKSKKVHVIVSCRTISEGVDLPNCDAVVILDPSRSVVTNVQRGLRACRLTPEERRRRTWENAVVFYPINVPQHAFVELVESTRDESTKDYLSKSIHAHSFEFAMTVVNFLKHDLELDVLLDFKCPGSSSGASARSICKKEARKSTHSTHEKPVSRVTFSLDKYVTWNIDQFRESATYLSTSMNVIGLDERWDSKYHLLREFMTQHGRTPSQTAKTKDEKTLGMWVSHRRKDYFKGKLSQDRIDQLESIPGWSWDPLQDSYDQNLAAVHEFMTQRGRTPSPMAKTKDEKALGIWASVRRREYVKGKLSQDRISQLESIPGWWWSKVQKPKSKSLKRSAPSVECSDQERTTKRPRQLSTISEYHKRFKSMSSSNLHQEFTSNPQTFHDYHQVASTNWSGFNSQDTPVVQVADIINNVYARTKTPMRIADFGAGIGTLKDHINPDHDLKGFDHVSVQPWIEARDMRDTGLDDQSVDVAVFSMSLWGSNWTDYIKEASRVLKFGGHTVLIDSTKRWFSDDHGQLMKSDESRIIKCLLDNGLVISKLTGLDTKFFCCIACKPLF